MSTANPEPIVCFSHLRWGFVYQRPQHILSRMAARRPVYYIEEPFAGTGPAFFLEETPGHNVTVLRPHVPAGDRNSVERKLASLLRAFVSRRRINDAILWYYTPMALSWSSFMYGKACVYDCMDELSMFAFAPPDLADLERRLFEKADVVFTGGRSLYYKKRKSHPNVRCFPSAVDAGHFAPRAIAEPQDIAAIPRPRFGFYGVVDERFDRDYVDGIARLRPEWQFIIVGPVVKIDPESLPRRTNIHYIGQRSYDELPAYLQHWDVAMLPFARNDATRFISPTKTLEYLAAGKPVISTPIADVVDPYGERGLVGIADTPERFVALGENVLRHPPAEDWHDEVRRLVNELSWEATVSAMSAEIQRATLARVLA